MPPVVIVCITRASPAVALRELVEISEDQLALAPGVTGVRTSEMSFRAMSFFSSLKRSRFRTGLRPNFSGMIGSVSDAEAVSSSCHDPRAFEFDHMAERIRDDVRVVLRSGRPSSEIFPSERARSAADGRFSGDDQVTSCSGEPLAVRQRSQRNCFLGERAFAAQTARKISRLKARAAAASLGAGEAAERIDGFAIAAQVVKKFRARPGSSSFKRCIKPAK